MSRFTVPASVSCVGVVIPARNEENSVRECLLSVIQALQVCETQADCWIVLVADACSDRTARVGRETLGLRGEAICSTAAAAGAARRLGANAVLKRFCGVPASRVWIANTDADTRVPSDWISCQLTYAATGATAVAGVVSVDSIMHQGTNRAREMMADYKVLPDGTHAHVHGANLGMRADAYLDAGGWPELALAEDHCLWHRIKARGWPVIAASASCVLTSGRLVGRAAGGFADTLRAKADKVYG